MLTLTGIHTGWEGSFTQAVAPDQRTVALRRIDSETP
jgi:hypothetical protein